MEEKNQLSFVTTKGVSKSKSLSSILILEIICFFFWLFGIFFFYLPLPKSSVAIGRLSGQPSPYDALVIVLSVIAALIIFYWLRRRHSLAPAVAVLLGIIIFSTLIVFVEPLVALAVVVLLVYVERAYRSFVTNNLLVILGVLAATFSFVGSYTTNFLLILLALFALYDIVAVFLVKAIPKVAQSAAENGMPLLLYVPKKKISWFSQPRLETISSMMGAGDLFIPLLFLTTVSLQFGWPTALCSFFGAVLGSGSNLLLIKKIKSGIPAIPFLAVGLATGYFLSRLVLF